MAQRENYKKLKNQLESFISHTTKAIDEYHKTHHSINKETLHTIADTVYLIEQSSDQILRHGDEDDKIEMQIIQNILHDQIYLHPRSNRKISFYQAAKSYKDLHDASEMSSLLQSCAEHNEESHHLFTDLTDICEYVADWIRKEKNL